MNGDGQKTTDVSTRGILGIDAFMQRQQLDQRERLAWFGTGEDHFVSVFLQIQLVKFTLSPQFQSTSYSN